MSGPGSAAAARTVNHYKDRIVKKLQAVVLIGWILLAGAGAARANFVETFTDGPGGWQAWTIDDAGWQQPGPVGFAQSDDWRGGFISAPVGSGPDRLYALQPPSAEPFANLPGATLIVDTKTTGLIEAAGEGDTPLVRFFVGSWEDGQLDYFVSTDAASWNPNADVDWTTHEIALIGQNFTRWPHVAAGGKTLEEVLAQPSELGLVFTGGLGSLASNETMGFYSEDGATVSVDAFATVSLWLPVPEPATLWMLAFGGLLLAARRRSQKKGAGCFS